MNFVNWTVFFSVAIGIYGIPSLVFLFIFLVRSLQGHNHRFIADEEEFSFLPHPPMILYDVIHDRN